MQPTLGRACARRLGAAPAIAVGIAAAMLVPACAHPRPPVPPPRPPAVLTEAPCPPPPSSVPAEPAPTLPRRCGTVAVPLEHRAPHGGTIDVAVSVLPATEPAPGAPSEPVVLLGGGPGEKVVAAISWSASVAGSPLAELRRTADLVVIDQRGVGAGRPALDCPPPDLAADVESGSPEEVAALVRSAQACHDDLVARSIDLGAFDTANNVRDLDVVRRALHYDRWHLFGTSYGARLAWQAARLFPDHLASLVLSSPVPAEENFIADIPSSFVRALDALVAACAADAPCAAAYPDLRADADALPAQLAAHPLSVTVTDPSTGQPVTLTVNANLAAGLLYRLFYFPAGPPTIPILITSLADGDTTGFGLVLRDLLAVNGAEASSTGMQLSFVCAEELAYLRPGQLDDELERSGPWGRAAWASLFAAFPGQCDVWRVPPAPREVFTPVRTAVPTLVVTGQLDQITPPAYGRTVQRQARASQYVEVPGAGHSPVLNAGPCGIALVVAFTADPRATLDTSCLPTAPTFTLPASEAADPAAPS